MIEQIFKLTQGNEKTVEKVIIDENIHYMHMILNKGECLPEHFSNAKNVYIIQYLFKELDGFENDVVTLYDIFSKFLLKIITSIEDNIVTEESIEEISGLKEKLCEVATKIDINYKEKLDKIMIIKTKN